MENTINTITIPIAEYRAMVVELARYHLIEDLRKTGKPFLDDAIKATHEGPCDNVPTYQMADYSASASTDSSSSGILE